MRPVLVALGLAVLGFSWLGPLPRLSHHAFFAHMTMHMCVVAVAAPLLALGLAGGRADPVRAAPALFAALPASLLELVVVWAWHVPALHQRARHTGPGLLAEQGSFLLTGLFLWLAAAGGDRTGRGPRRAAGVIALLLTSMHMTLLGALLALAPRVLYPHAGGVGGLSPLEDQHLGGAIMILLGGASYLLGGLGLTRTLLPARREERG